MNLLRITAILLNSILCSHVTSSQDQPNLVTVGTEDGDLGTSSLGRLIETKVRLTHSKPSLLGYAEHLEQTILEPVLIGDNSDLIERWIQAIKENKTEKELERAANDLLASYEAWNAQRDRAVKTVIGHSDLGTVLFSKIEIADIAPVAGSAKSMLAAIEKRLAAKYLEKEKLDWTTLFKALKASKPPERGHLIELMFKHWPKTEDGLVRALLMHVEYYVQAYLRDKEYQRKELPYIPGNLELYNGLAEAGVIEPYHFPMEAFYHEEPNVIEISKLPVPK